MELDYSPRTQRNFKIIDDMEEAITKLIIERKYIMDQLKKKDEELQQKNKELEDIKRYLERLRRMSIKKIEL